MEKYRLRVLLAGARGFVGTSLLEKLSDQCEVNTISRFQSTGILFKYDTDRPQIPYLDDHYDVILNCAFDFRDTRVEDNINYRITRNLLTLRRLNKIPFFINISSINAFDFCPTKYGKIKLNVENIVAAERGISLRIGLVDPFKKGSSLYTLREVNHKSDLFSIGLCAERILIYKTCSDQLARLIVFLVINRSTFPEYIYTIVTGTRLDFNTAIGAHKGRFRIFIPLGLMRLFLKASQMLGIKIKRFSADNFTGLLNHPTDLVNKLNLDETK